MYAELLSQGLVLGLSHRQADSLPTEPLKNPPTNAEDPSNAGSVLSWKDPLEEGMTTHSRIPAWTEQAGPMNRGAWWATVHKVTNSST